MSIQAHSPLSDIQIPMSEIETAIINYAAGKLTPARHALIACAIELNPDVAEFAALNTSVAASLLDEVKPVSLSPLFIGKVLEALSFGHPYDVANDHNPKRIMNAPPVSKGLVNRDVIKNMSWKSLIPGVAVRDVLGNRKTKNGERLYLLKVKGGMRMPEHTHQGEEWALILSGGYRVDGKIYKRGDLHFENETNSHSPIICEGEDCICLAMTEAPLVMKNWLPKLVQRVVGI